MHYASQPFHATAATVVVATAVTVTATAKP